MVLPRAIEFHVGVWRHTQSPGSETRDTFGINGIRIKRRQKLGAKAPKEEHK